MIIIGGDENSFNTAMDFLRMEYPVLVLDGSGGAADFICKGYRLSTYKTRYVSYWFIVIPGFFLVIGKPIFSLRYPYSRLCFKSTK